MYNKCYVLDTNVLIENPKAIYEFPESLVVIPFVVVEELDNLKVSSDIDVRRKSRMASNLLDRITEESEEDIINIGKGSGLLIEMNHQGFIEINPEKPDNRIMSVAIGMASDENYNFEEVVLVSLDTNVRLMIRNYGKKLDLKAKLVAEKYAVKETVDDISPGYIEEFVSPDAIFKFREVGEIKIDKDYMDNEHIVLIDNTNLNNVAFGSYSSVSRTVVKIKDYKKGKCVFKDVRPLNMEQNFAMNDILDISKNVNIVTSKTAGCGKNYIITACCLNLLGIGENEKISDKTTGQFDRLIILKPMIAVGGQEIGFLPGEKEDKTAPWFANQEDIMDELLGGKIESYYKMLEQRVIELDVVTFMRGRSIPNSIIFIDEAQNFKPEEIKTLLTRAGKNVKIIIAGDLSQIDHPRLDALNCGLNVWSDRARHPELGYKNSTYICLKKSVRSEIADWASQF